MLSTIFHGVSDCFLFFHDSISNFLDFLLNTEPSTSLFNCWCWLLLNDTSYNFLIFCYFFRFTFLIFDWYFHCFVIRSQFSHMNFRLRNVFYVVILFEFILVNFVICFLKLLSDSHRKNFFNFIVTDTSFISTCRPSS